MVNWRQQQQIAMAPSENKSVDKECELRGFWLTRIVFLRSLAFIYSEYKLLDWSTNFHVSSIIVDNSFFFSTVCLFSLLRYSPSHEPQWLCFCLSESRKTRDHPHLLSSALSQQLELTKYSRKRLFQLLLRIWNCHFLTESKIAIADMVNYSVWEFHPSPCLCHVSCLFGNYKTKIWHRKPRKTNDSPL